jgi:hypothetical protein
MSAAVNIGWGPIDPADWQPDEPAMTEEQAAIVCAEVCRRDLEKKRKQLRIARARQRHTHAAMMQAAAELEESIKLFEASVREWAALRSGRAA